jgi:hypothetical protein
MIKKERQTELIEFVNGLSNDDVCHVINMLSDRLDVYVGLLNNHCIASPVAFACLNGTMVQINLHLADLDDLQEDSFFEHAMKATKNTVVKEQDVTEH